MADKTYNANLQPSNGFGVAKEPSSHVSNGFNPQSTTSNISNKLIVSGINSNYNMNAQFKAPSAMNLLSPPEAAPYDSFSPKSFHASIASSKPSSGFLAINATLPSPPVSPETRLDRPDESGTAIRDPILYPNREVSVQAPLFTDDEDELEAQKVVEAHMSARAMRKKQFREASPPVRDDYVLALEFKSQVARLFNADQRKWAARERSYLAEDERIRKAHQRRTLANIAPAPSGITKSVKKPIATPTTRPSKPCRPKPVAGKPNGDGRGARGTTPGAKPTGGIRNPPTNGTTREDKDFEALPDYCPPISTLPQKSNSLKVDWKGSPIDLSNDPHRHLLHPDEVILAANLRLDCATYLTSKRRIFISRVDCLERGKEFRKTDSQQACKIDVNKASKLWQAFEKVGWLRRDYFVKFADFSKYIDTKMSE